MPTRKSTKKTGSTVRNMENERIFMHLGTNKNIGEWVKNKKMEMVCSSTRMELYMMVNGWTTSQPTRVKSYIQIKIDS